MPSPENRRVCTQQLSIAEYSVEMELARKIRGPICDAYMGTVLSFQHTYNNPKLPFMSGTRFQLVPFQPHPSLQISGTVVLEIDRIDLQFSVRDPDALVRFVPASASPARKAELWRSTCFELFVKRPDDPAYWEYNLVTSGDWNVYRFTHCRSPLQCEPDVADIVSDTQCHGSALNGIRGQFPLPAQLKGQPLEIGISCVIEDRNGGIHYFALSHPGAKPDFHNAAAYLIRLGTHSK